MRLLDRPIVIIGLDGAVRNPTEVAGYEVGRVKHQYSGEPIFVSYNGTNHYDALLLKAGFNSRAILARLRPSSAIQVAVGDRQTIQPTAPPHLSQSSSTAVVVSEHLPLLSVPEVEEQGIYNERDYGSINSTLPIASGLINHGVFSKSKASRCDTSYFSVPSLELINPPQQIELDDLQQNM